MSKQVNEELLREIDQLELGDRILAFQKAVSEASNKIHVDRQRLALESWKATEGEDIEIRRAKLFKNIVENVPIRILDFDGIAGRLTTTVIGASTAIDACGDYIAGLWEDSDDLNISVTKDSMITPEEKNTLRESAAYFRGKSAPDKAYETLRNVVGTWAEDYEAAKGKDPQLYSGFFPGVTSTVMFDKILKNGLNGIIEEAQANIDAFIESQDTDVEKLYFWKSSIMVLEAAINHANRYADLAEEMAASEQNPERAAELLEMARICRKVPAEPAESFREAVQSVAIVGVCKNLEHPIAFYPQLARADQYLYPYFKKDIEEGNITIAQAAELLEELIGRWGTQIFVSSSSMKQTHQINFGINNMMIGGVDVNGEDAGNELSYLLLHIIGLLKQSSPTVGFRWNPNAPRWLLEKAVETNFKTKGGIPLFENDDHVIKNFCTAGIPIEQAREWYGLGCVNPALPAKVKHSGVEGAGAMSVALVFDIMMHNGVAPVAGKKLGIETGDPRDFETFEELYDAFKRQFEYISHKILYCATIVRSVNERFFRLPFLSSIITQGCMDAGKDTMRPDPDYHIFVLHDRAIVDTADSLTAVKHLVYDEKKLTMDELLEALDSNFEGERGEEIRQMCLKAPKFGNDIDEADEMVKDLGIFTAHTIYSFDNGIFPHYEVVREGLSWHYFGGLGVGALPDGRKAKEPLNDGSLSPMRGADVNGPTAVLRSCLKVEFKESQATVLNQKFSSSILESPDSRGKLADYTDTFLRCGGQHIQYNIMDAAELHDAQVHPEDHKDLVVRVGGFSAFFVQLSPEMQNDIVSRTEFSM